MPSPRYFFALFGYPKPPEKDTVDSGIYHPDPKFAPFPTRPGDMLLLYCSADYPGHEKEVPGIGVVLSADDEAIRYRYLPFIEPIPKSRLDKGFESEDLKKFGDIRFSTRWLFEISRESFAKTLGAQAILWPK